MQEDRNMLLLPSDAVLRSSLVAFPYYLNHTNTRRARHVPEQTYRRISLHRNMSCSSPPPSDAVARRNSVTFFIAYIDQIQEDRNMLLNKPTVGSV